MKSGLWSPSKKNAYALNEKTIGGTKQNILDVTKPVYYSLGFKRQI
jgi:hypothetical protein